jgi:hypothetical protein
VANGTCSIDGCEKPHEARGWCIKHYRRWQRHGDPLWQLPTTADYFWEKVRKADRFDPDTCWLWTAPPDSNGYGRLKVAVRMVRAHIFAYELLVGPVPDGLELDHLCHGRDKSCKGGSTCIHRRCVNPGHLEAVTHRTNVLRGVSPVARCAVKTHCPAGHAYSPENTRLYRGSRYCRACRRAWDAARAPRQAP